MIFMHTIVVVVAGLAAAAASQSDSGPYVWAAACKACTTCHSERGPHFKFFNYGAMAPLSHSK